MRDGVVDEIIYIEEKSYQKLKEELCKKNDYFSIQEINLTTFLTTFYMDKMNKKD